MKKLVATLVFGAAVLSAQTAELRIYRAVMLPSNESPAGPDGAKGAATIYLHIVRDAAGKIASGSVDFNLHYSFPTDVTVTGLHIHNGPAGVNAGIVIPTDVRSMPAAAGPQAISRQAQVRPDDSTGLAALNGILQDPSGYYVNIHTTDNPGGAMRGQLQAATGLVLMGIMSSGNETRTPTMDAAGIAHVSAIATRDAGGNLTSGEVNLSFTYNFPQQVTFTGCHIHPGAAGVDGPAVLGATLPANLMSEANGQGAQGPFYREIALDNALDVQTFENLFTNPGADYFNVHTSTNPAGAMRTQLHPTDMIVFQAPMVSSNEPAAPELVNASAPSRVAAHVLRYEDGTVQAGVVTFDANYRFPGATDFTVMHIHDGKAGVSGGAMIPAPLPADQLASADGFGNFYVNSAIISGGPALATLSDMMVNPENHYLNLHTKVSPAGAVRAQLAPPNSAPGVVKAVISADQDKAGTTVAPGELISIYGTNLAKVASGLDGWQGSTIPEMLNGVAVAIGGQRARLLYVSPEQVNAQVPFETPAGMQSLVLNNGNGPGAAVNVQVAAVAPAIFFTDQGGIVVKSSDFSLVSPGNPAHAGDVIVIYATGLGQTTPALATGALVSDANAKTATVSVTLGGKDAAVVYSVAAPGFVGLYQVAAMVPAGLPAGNASLAIKSGAVTSNTVTIALQ